MDFVDNVNIADFAMIEESENDIIFQWEEMRDIFGVVVESPDKEALSKLKLEYWRRHWPQQRVPKGAVVGAGGSGWMRDDDWFNGEWKTADVKVKFDGSKAIFEFNPINAQEFTDVADFDAIYRRTLKIRLVFENKKPEINSIAI
ncbi:TPA: hypothetical protein ENX78_08705, partial [Candidatus Poribacteria bacterium]|nr:hypothetical protein [Candidatus Poribacteria bacterium]